jgi:LPXTG-site transpeptidase (sortase) family protein
MNLSKTLSKRTLLIIILAGFVLSLAFMLSYILKRPIQSSWVPPTASITTVHKPKKVIAELPVRLKIPAISVDAALDYVGLTSQGYLGVPQGPTNAAWYDQGPRPGEAGDAVIDGHFGYKNHIPAVFDNLHALQKGDNLYTVDEKGLTTTFVVRQVRTYGQNQDDTDVFVSSDGKAHLNLITCQGDWNQAQKSYSSRLVVFADEVTK